MQLRLSNKTFDGFERVISGLQLMIELLIGIFVGSSRSRTLTKKTAQSDFLPTLVSLCYLWIRPKDKINLL